MGLYATLEDALLACPECNSELEKCWQFRLGFVMDMPTYKIGDEIIWKYRNYGKPGEELVYAIGYPVFCGECTNCGYQDYLSLIKIFDNQIVSVEFYKHTSWVPEIYLIGTERKPIR